MNYHLSGEVSSTIVVPNNYTTIQAAIDNADEGDTILVLPGKYVECLTIDKSLKLVGSGNSTVIENSGRQNTIAISPGTTGVTIESFYVNGSGTGTGIYVLRCVNNIIQNNIIANHHIGIHIYDSSEIIMRNNLMVRNHYNLRVWGLFLSHFLHNIDTSNLADGKPVYYWISQHNKTVPLDAGYVAIVNSSNIIVKNLNLSHNLSGVLLAYTNDSFVVNVTASTNERGIYMVYSHSNTVVNSNFFGNEWCGISTISSTDNFIARNTLRNNKFAFRLSHSFPLLPCYSTNNVICGNTVENCMDGVYFEESNDNQLSGNLIVDNKRYGIVLDGSTGNSIYKNLIESNEYGIWVYRSNNNMLYWNNFVNNTAQVDIFSYYPSVNTWDSSYPSGGNYWSNYNGTDAYRGPYQNVTGSDDLGDTPYVFGSSNQDRYPLFHSSNGNSAPKAKFTFYPASPRVEETVYFTDESVDSDDKIVVSIWNFGNGYLSRGVNVSKSFEKEGNYTITLNAFDDEGSEGIYVENVFVRRFFCYLFLSAPNYVTVGEEVEMSAMLLSEEGDRLSNSTINFYLIDGNLSEWIGCSVTNSSGTAIFLYKPVKAGDFEIEASYENDSLYMDSIDIQPLNVAEEFQYLRLVLAISVVLTIIVVIVKKVFRKSREAKNGANR